jgi:hypothetical protein
VTPREAELLWENESLKDQLAEAQRQIAMLVRHAFGRKTEQTPPHSDQPELTLEIEAAAIGCEPAPPTRPKRGSRKGRRAGQASAAGPCLQSQRRRRNSAAARTEPR